jgi:DNA polymerase-3 subunit delta
MTGRAEALEEALTRALTLAVNPQQLLTTMAFHVAMLRRWRAELDAGRSARDVLDGARPRPHFSRRSALELQLRLWTDIALAAAGTRLHSALAASRRRPALAAALLERTLLALCRMAAEH